MPQRIVTFKRWQVVSAFVAVTVAFVVMGVLLNNAIGKNGESIRAIRDANARLHTVLVGVCELRRDLRDRAQSGARQLRQSEKFLRDHPKGLPSLGFGAKAIKAEIDQQAKALAGQERSVAALSVVRCPRKGAA